MKKIEIIFVLFLIILGIYYMYLASQTRMLGEDEGQYFLMGKYFSEFEYPASDNTGKPFSVSPLVSVFYALFFIIFGQSLSVAKIVTVIFGMLTVLLVYLTGKRINIWYGIVSAFLLLSMSLFSHFMFIAYVEVPIAFFSILATYMILNQNTYKKSILTGIILSLSFFTKQTGLFLIAGFIIFEFIMYYKKRNIKILKMIMLTLIVSLSLCSLFLIRNIMLYNYPYIHFLNLFFEAPEAVTAGAWEEVTGIMLSIPLLTYMDYASNIGTIVFVLGIFSLSWILIYKETKKELLISLILSALFLILYYIYYILELGIAEPRNIFTIFPHLSLLAGFFVFKVKEKHKYLIITLFTILILSLYTSITIATRTSSSQRYPDDYIQAMEWLKKNTDKDSIILTTYGGSLKYYAERNNVWLIRELPEVMSTSNTTYIYEIMKKYNVSYILIWRGVLFEKFAIPESNLMGVFTYNFLDTIKDNEHFETVYQNENNVIFEVV